MLKIYGIPLSVHTRKVIVAAIEKGLDYENVVIVPVNPATLPPDWAKLSPTGKIPVMADGDTLVADSTVICTYLERTYPAKPIYPADTKDFIRSLWLEEYADSTVFPTVVHPLFHQTFVGPKLHGRKVDQAAVDGVCNETIPRVFGYLEGVIDGGFAAGSKLSMADIAIVSNLVTYQYLGFPLDAKKYPKLATYFERGVRTPSILRALRAEQGAVESMGLRRDFLEAALA